MWTEKKVCAVVIGKKKDRLPLVLGLLTEEKDGKQYYDTGAKGRNEQ